MIRIACFLILWLPAALLQARSLPIEIKPAYPNSLTAVASALNVSQEIAVQARALNLEEALGWVIMLMAKKCACPVSTLMERRLSMTWGEVAESTGYAWVDLIEEARFLTEAAGLRSAAPSTEQMFRSMRNDPDGEGAETEP